MLTTTGTAETSALQILGELAVRAGPAYRLDPRLFKSGESVEKRPRITCSGKARVQAVVAVMRKLLRAPFAMFGSNQPYDGSKLCAVDLAGKAVAACA
jgi:transposase